MVKKLLEPPPPVKDSLTGGQIQEILDYLIVQSLSPVIRNSNIFDAQVAYILSAATKNKKRKLSALPREEFISTLCQYLSTQNPEVKISLLEIAKIERGFLYNFVFGVLKKLEPFLQLYEKSLVCDEAEGLRLDKKLDVVAKEIRMDKDKIFCTYTSGSDYLRLAYDFRNSIVNNYVKYVHKQAKAFCSTKSNNFDYQDVCHNFLTAVTKAIDKYDCSKGALTSYINWWILNVQTSSTEHGHEYGMAYSIPQLQRKNLALKDPKKCINFGVSLDTLLSGNKAEEFLNSFVTPQSGLEEDMEVDEEAELIKYLIKKADIDGVARLYLDTSEYFSQKEFLKMVQIMKQQGTLNT